MSIENRKNITPTFNIPCGMLATELQKLSINTNLPKDKIVISVSVINWCREFDVIVSSLLSIIRQDFPVANYEIIVVDDASEPPYDKYVRDAVQFIMETFPKVNLRTYFTNHTRSWRDPHVTNVALRKSLGEIFMLSYSDIVHIGETLNSAWTYHSEYDNLFLMPTQVKSNLHTKSWQNIFPETSERPGTMGHQYGVSLLRHRAADICGLNETIIHEPSDFEFQAALCHRGIVHVVDHDVAVSQPWSTVIISSTSRGKYPRREHSLRNTLDRWTTEDQWGLLTKEEESTTIFSDAMKTTIQKTTKRRTGL